MRRVFLSNAFRLVTTFAFLGFLLMPGCRASLPPHVAEEISDEGPEPGPNVHEVWRSLDKTKKLWGMGQNRVCDVFDYHPNGGMRIFYCHLVSVAGDAPMEDLLGGAPAIFLEGPHGDGLPEVGSCEEPGQPCTTSFGHYNPDFVRWASKALIPGADDAVFRQETQGLYDRFVRPLARTFWAAHRKLEADRACARAELERYRAAIQAGTLGYYERWFDLLQRDFCGGEAGPIGYPRDSSRADGLSNGNVVKGAAGFWLRRTMDGTRPLFAQALERLLVAYDEAWVDQFRLPGEP